MLTCFTKAMNLSSSVPLCKFQLLCIRLRARHCTVQALNHKPSPAVECHGVRDLFQLHMYRNYVHGPVRRDSPCVSPLAPHPGYTISCPPSRHPIQPRESNYNESLKGRLAASLAAARHVMPCMQCWCSLLLQRCLFTNGPNLCLRSDVSLLQRCIFNNADAKGTSCSDAYLPTALSVCAALLWWAGFSCILLGLAAITYGQHVSAAKNKMAKKD